VQAERIADRQTVQAKHDADERKGGTFTGWLAISDVLPPMAAMPAAAPTAVCGAQRRNRQSGSYVIPAVKLSEEILG